MAVLKITFSPTGGTENCAYIVANTLSSIVEDIDLTDRTVDFTQVEVAVNLSSVSLESAFTLSSIVALSS